MKPASQITDRAKMYRIRVDGRSYSRAAFERALKDAIASASVATSRKATITLPGLRVATIQCLTPFHPHRTLEYSIDIDDSYAQRAQLVFRKRR